MKSNAKLRKMANAIATKYCRRIPTSDILKMYEELEAIGITTGLVHGDASDGSKTCEWYYNGEQIENSMFVYSIYRDNDFGITEYNIYFS